MSSQSNRAAQTNRTTQPNRASQLNRVTQLNRANRRRLEHLRQLKAKLGKPPRRSVREQNLKNEERRQQLLEDERQELNDLESEVGNRSRGNWNGPNDYFSSCGNQCGLPIYYDQLGYPVLPRLTCQQYLPIVPTMNISTPGCLCNGYNAYGGILPGGGVDSMCTQSSTVPIIYTPLPVNVCQRW